jgi:asparagine synthase (glutamine-hydrolysing)
MLPYSSGENYDESGISEKKWNIRRMLLDTQTYLPDDIHCKVDRASMKYSVEARSPFMDYRMVELALSMPHRYKQKGNKGKRLIKDVSWKMIPKELLDRPKSGFEVPIEKWLKNELRDDLVRVSRTEYIESQKIFDSIETPKMIDEYLLSDRSEFGNITMVIWSFYVFQLWYDRYKQYISEVDS